MTATKTAPLPTLPLGILSSDLSQPKDSWKLWKGHDVPYEDRSFDLWHTTGFGWCIPTLLIAAASYRRPGQPERTYATTIDGKVVRIGAGPHVTHRLTVYLRPSRMAALKKFLDLREAGRGSAGQVRDRISSRRAQGQVMRAQGRSSWQWDV